MRRVGGLNEAEFKKRDAKYTRASVVMVVAFVVCNTPRFVPNFMEIIVGLDASPPVNNSHWVGWPKKRHYLVDEKFQWGARVLLGVLGKEYKTKK